jgi:hypothetical protein
MGYGQSRRKSSAMYVKHDVLVRLRFVQCWQVAEKQRQPFAMARNSKMLLAGVELRKTCLCHAASPVDECHALETLNCRLRSSATAKTVALLGTLRIALCSETSEGGCSGSPCAHLHESVPGMNAKCFHVRFVAALGA